MLDAATVDAVGAAGERTVDGFGDIAPFCPMFDVDALLDRWSDSAGGTRRRLPPRRGTSASPSQETQADRKTPPQPKVDLILYMSPASEKSQRALRAVREVLKDYESEQVHLTTCDLSVEPQQGEVDSVVFTPTLVTQGPGPRTAIIGNLEDKDVLRDLLDANGVDRRWDD